MSDILIKNIKYRSVIPTMTSDTTPAPYSLTCTSVYMGSPLYKAFDNDDTTYIRTPIDQKAPWVLTIDLGEINKTVVSAYQLRQSYNNSTWSMNTWTFEGSNDNTTWDVLHKVTNHTWNLTKTYSFQFDNTTEYRYYRFNCSKKNGDNSICFTTVTLLSKVEGVGLEFSKCLERNLPQSRTDGTDTMYFTEKGNIYTTTGDGTLLKMCDVSEIPQLKEEIKTINKAQKYVNTGLDYCFLTMSETHANTVLQLNEIIPFDTVKEIYGIECDTENYFVTLKKGKTYKIDCDVFINGQSIEYDIYDATNSIMLRKGVKSTKSSLNDTSTTSASCIYTPTQDSVIKVQVSQILDNGTLAGDTVPYSSYFIVQEIGRAIHIDPIEHLNTSSGLEDAPVGHIISHMGKNAPKHYLACDGTLYSINDYPYLTQHIIDEFGSVNYFGGDGATTFAVPDLRGEFLRGTGVSTRDTGTGAEVGVHQDATKIKNMLQVYSNRIYIPNNGNDSTNLESIASNSDKEYRVEKTTYANYYSKSGLVTWDTTNTTPIAYSSRPTNTAVLYCIKYEPTYFMSYTSSLVGFSQTTVFEGEAKTTDEYSLTDSLDNYDKIEVYSCVDGKTNISSLTIDKENKASLHTISSYIETNGYYSIRFSFSSNEILKIDLITSGSDWSSYSPMIYKVVGIKGVPSYDFSELSDSQVLQLKAKLGI